jgi:hypothetical protein
MSIWKCEDCHKVGFYFDITAEEMTEKHKKECESQSTPVSTETVGLPEGGLYLNWSDKRIK